jgi:hypothetical protein
MPQSTQTLPDGYEQVFSIDMATNKSMAIVLNLAGLVAMFFTFWLLTIFVTWVRPELAVLQLDRCAFPGATGNCHHGST